MRIAAVVVAWNVLRHFYPYHDVIGDDWDALLAPTIDDVLDDADAEDLYDTLRRLVHGLHDGHGYARGPIAPRARLPVSIARIDGEFVVLAAAPGSAVERHDRLISIDGVEMKALFEREAVFVSGSPQFIEHQLLGWAEITRGPLGSHAAVALRRGGELLRVDAERVNEPVPPEFERPAFEVLRDGIVYVDLARMSEDRWRSKIAAVAKAKGVVIDVRGYPASEAVWLPHLLAAPERAKWMRLPLVTKPDGEDMEFLELGWDLDPAKPRIGGEVAFITGAGAVSNAESVLAYVAGHRLGEIVGSPTAGANGNLSSFDVPGGFRIGFTGMKVVGHDGGRHHIIGIRPTIPVERTLDGVLAGRDEELEAAVAAVRGRSRRGSGRDRVGVDRAASSPARSQ